MKKYEVWTFDVWGNAEDGFEVNDRRHDYNCTFDHEPSNEELLNWFVDQYGCESHEITVDDSNEGSFFFEDAETGEPLVELIEVPFEFPENLKPYWNEDKQAFIPYAWPGGYTIIYVTHNGNVLCPECATKEIKDPDSVDQVVAADTYDEGPTLYCDGCNTEIESSYGDPDNPED